MPIPRSSPRAEYSSVSRSRSPSGSRGSTRLNDRDPLNGRALAIPERAPSPPRPVGPALQPADTPVVGALVMELNEIAASRDRFSDRSLREVRADASDFFRYRIKSLGAIKRPTKGPGGFYGRPSAGRGESLRRALFYYRDLRLIAR